jgi:hypothetical protein
MIIARIAQNCRLVSELYVFLGARIECGREVRSAVELQMGVVGLLGMLDLWTLDSDFWTLLHIVNAKSRKRRWTRLGLDEAAPRGSCQPGWGYGAGKREEVRGA